MAYAWVAIVVSSSLLGGCATKRCEGQPITCVDNADLCDSVPGCRTVGACRYALSETDATCQSLLTEEGCTGTTASACRWAPPSCVSACDSLPDIQTCQAFSFMDPRLAGQTLTCAWSSCTGIPTKKFCGDYSSDACPARLGCHLEASDPVGT